MGPKGVWIRGVALYCTVRATLCSHNLCFIANAWYDSIVVDTDLLQPQVCVVQLAVLYYHLCELSVNTAMHPCISACGTSDGRPLTAPVYLSHLVVARPLFE